MKFVLKIVYTNHNLDLDGAIIESIGYPPSSGYTFRSRQREMDYEFDSFSEALKAVARIRNLGLENLTTTISEKE